MLARRLLLLLAAVSGLSLSASGSSPTASGAPDSAKAGWTVADADLGPADTLRWTVEEGTWMCLDVSPDGRWIVFDLLGDIYRIPIGGGTAELLRGGRPYEVQPRYSPDGAWISFTSDAGGGDNVWVMASDGSGARQVTKEDFRLLNNATWTPDGRFLIARKHFTSRRSLGAGEMWMYDVFAGGAGVQLTKRPNDQKDVNEPEVSPDGRHLYYCLDSTPGPVFEYNKDPNATIYTMRRLDLLTGEEITYLDEPGGSVRPEISPDGTRLAYVRRARTKSVLMVRDLATGIERALYSELSRDTQETWSVFGVYPGFAWTPDGDAIVVWAKGKIRRIDVATGAAAVVPFRAAIAAPVTEALRFAPDIFGDTFPVQVIRWPRVSPDGTRVVFQALGYLWTRDLAGGEPKRLTQGADFEFHPVWTPDGGRIVYTTWNDVEGGRIMAAGARGGAPRAVVDAPGHYAAPSVSPDGRRVVFQKTGGDVYRGDRFTVDPGIYVAPLDGSAAPRLVSKSGAAPRFDATGERILLYESKSDLKTLYSVNLLGGDRRDVATSERARELVLSPDGRWIAFEELWDVYVAPRPAAAGPVSIGPAMKNLPVRKVSGISGEFLDWSKDSKVLSFGLGPDLYRIGVDTLFGAGTEAIAAEPDSVHLGWTHPADVPNTAVALTGATVLTMAEPPVLEDAVVVVRGNRIAAVGRRGEVDVSGTREIDVRGKVLLPGYVDTHAHMGSSNQDMHAQQSWAYLANLAFGVTTTHDPSNNTRMVFASGELVRAGSLLGPRITSTGTILYGAEGEFKAVTNSLDDARRHLARLKAYGAFSAKSYNQPRREQRQWYIRAGRDLEMMIVPEGGSFFAHNMTMFLDGHTTLEHALPLAELYEDALGLVAGTRTAYTPTLIVGYGGIWGENYWYQKTNVWENERLLTFVPRSVVDPRSRRRVMAPDDEFNHVDIARYAAEVVKRGGLATVGAHGQMQGIGVHWELWMFAQGGLEPMDALRVATLHGARALGMDGHIGSIEMGKIADLIVLDADPREDIRNSAEVALVMANGRLYDARSLDQIAPEAKKLPPGPPLESIPMTLIGHGCDHVDP